MADEATILERVQELTWAWVDGEISDDEMSLLDSLLLSDDAARKRYIECMQLHAALAMRYAPGEGTAKSAVASKSPVLGFLNAGLPVAGFDFPPVEDLKS
jgi:hypothetical protein